MLDRSSPAGVLDRIRRRRCWSRAPRTRCSASARPTPTPGASPRTAPRSRWSGTPAATTRRPRTGSPPTCATQVAGWFDFHLRGDGRATRAPASSSPRPPGSAAAASARVQGGSQTVVADAYPGLDGAEPGRRAPASPLSGPTQPVVTPAGGTPAALTTVPGPRRARPRRSAATTLEIPGQFAAFDSEPLDAAVEVVGAPTVDARRLRAQRDGDAVRQALRRRPRRRDDAARRAWSPRWR